MKLGGLVSGGGDASVTGFAIDHRKVAPGTIFGAFEGAKVNGEDYIPAAIAAGAIAIVARPDATVEGALHIADDNPRQRFAHLAAAFFAPFPQIAVAVTGTNGKTSTVEMTRQLWRMAGHHAASIGTLGVTTSDDSVLTGLTTPDVVTFLSNVALQFADLLGDHRIGVQYYSVATFSNFVATYMNFKHRNRWGVALFDLRDYYLSRAGSTAFLGGRREIRAPNCSPSFLSTGITASIPPGISKHGLLLLPCRARARINSWTRPPR